MMGCRITRDADDNVDEVQRARYSDLRERQCGGYGGEL